MFGIQSIGEFDAWVTQRFGKRTAKWVAVIALLAVLGVFVSGIALGVRSLMPAARALWQLVPGVPARSFTLTEILPSVVAAAMGLGVAIWVYRWGYRLAQQIADVERTNRFVREWLSTVLERRLKSLEQGAASLDSVSEAHKTVQEQLADLRARIRALEYHTDIDGLAELFESSMGGVTTDHKGKTVGELLGMKPRRTPIGDLVPPRVREAMKNTTGRTT